MTRRRWLGIISFAACVAVLSSSSSQWDAAQAAGHHDFADEVVFLETQFSGHGSQEVSQSVWAMNPDGSRRRRLAYANAFAVSLNRSEIAVEVDNPQTLTRQISLLRPGGIPEPLVQAMAYTQIAWSPDGESIAFTHNDGGDPRTESLWLVNRDGSGEHPLTVSPAGDEDTEVSWSPDGRQLAFQRYNGSGYSLEIVNANGTGLRQVSLPSTCGGNFPRWSPNSQLLLFTVSCQLPKADGSTQRLWLAGRRGTDPHPLMKRQAAGGLWSPNGKSIAFGYTPANSELGRTYVVRADGRAMRLVAQSAAISLVPTDWSPNGKFLLLHGSFKSQLSLGAVYLVNVAGGTPARLTRTSDADDGGGDW